VIQSIFLFLLRYDEKKSLILDLQDDLAYLDEFFLLDIEIINDFLSNCILDVFVIRFLFPLLDGADDGKVFI
jgi:hypothetical protein